MVGRNQKNNWTLCKWYKTVQDKKVALISVQKSQKIGKGLIFNPGVGNGKPLLREYCLVHPEALPVVLQTRWTSSS